MFNNKIDIHRLRSLLKQKGYYSYYTQKSGLNKSEIVRVKGNVVEIVNLLDLLPIFNTCLNPSESAITEKELIDEIILNLSKHDPDWAFSFYPFRGEFLKSTKESSYFFFKNTIVIVSKDGIKQKSYEDLTKYVWKSQIVQCNFDPVPVEKIKKTSYYEFLRGLSYYDFKFIQELRLESLISFIGGIINSGESGLNRRKFIFTESYRCSPEDHEIAMSTMIKSFAAIVPTVKISAKSVLCNLDIESYIKDDTKLVIITDAYKVCPDDLNPYLIKYPDINILLISKYPLISDSKIQWCSSISLNMDDQNTKHPNKFFSNWDSKEFNLFNNLMLYANQHYKIHGLIKAESLLCEEYDRTRKKTNPEFMQFMDKIFKPDEKFNWHSLFDEFKSSSWHSNNTEQFKKWLKYYAEYRSCKLVWEKNIAGEFFSFK